MTIHGSQFVTKQPAVSKFEMRDRDINTDIARFFHILLLVVSKGKQLNYSRTGLCGSALLTFLRLPQPQSWVPNCVSTCQSVPLSSEAYGTYATRARLDVFEIRNNFWYYTLVGCDAVNCGREKIDFSLTFCLNLHSTIIQISEQSVFSLFEL